MYLILAEKIDVWRKKIEVALGSQRRLIMEAVPELVRIIPEQEQDVVSAGTQSDNMHRFMIAFQRYDTFISYTLV